MIEYAGELVRIGDKDAITAFMVDCDERDRYRVCTTMLIFSLGINDSEARIFVADKIKEHYWVNGVLREMTREYSAYTSKDWKKVVELLVL